MSLKNLFRSMTIKQLLNKRKSWEKEIEANSGRSTSDSSYWLDYALENVEDINAVLKEKGHTEDD